MRKYRQKKKRNYDKDSNSNYTLVTSKQLIEFKGSIEDFLNKITNRKVGYLKKERGRNILHFWWEDKEKWFMNRGHQKTKKFVKGGWMIASDMKSYLKFLMREGYQLLLKSNK